MFFDCSENGMNAFGRPMRWKVEIDECMHIGGSCDVCDKNASRGDDSGPYLVLWWEPSFLYSCE